MKIVSMKMKIMKKILYFLLFLFNCSGIITQKEYCEKRANYYFTLCIASLNITPNYMNRPEWRAGTVQDYGRNYCLIEYLRKNRCVDKSSLPRKDEK